MIVGYSIRQSKYFVKNTNKLAAEERQGLRSEKRWGFDQTLKYSDKCSFLLNKIPMIGLEEKTWVA